MKVDNRIIILMLSFVAICLIDINIFPRYSKEAVAEKLYREVKRINKNTVTEYFLVSKEGDIHNIDLSTFGHLQNGTKFNISKSKILGIQKQISYLNNDELITVSVGRFTKSLDKILLLDFILLSVALCVNFFLQEKSRELLLPIVVLPILFGLFTLIIILIDVFIY